MIIPDRRVLMSLAVRMLGSASEAEDILQEAWIRSEGGSYPRAWWMTVVTRLCVDHLRSARVRREAYPGVWLPEPVPDELLDEVEARDALSVGVLLLMERLSPAERAALVLHDAFEWPYEAIGALLGRSAVACRQLRRRARLRLDEAGPADGPAPAELDPVVFQLLWAARTGDVEGLRSLWADDATLHTDGGGLVVAVGRPLRGELAARALHGILAQAPNDGRLTTARLCGEPAVLAWIGQRLVGALWFRVAEGRVRGVRWVVAPPKLAVLGRVLGVEVGLPLRARVHAKKSVGAVEEATPRTT